MSESHCSKVYKSIIINTKEIILLEKIKLDSDDLSACIIRNIAALKEINHKNVVQLKEVIKMQTKIYLVFEFM